MNKASKAAKFVKKGAKGKLLKKRFSATFHRCARRRDDATTRTRFVFRPATAPSRETDHRERLTSDVLTVHRPRTLKHERKPAYPRVSVPSKPKLDRFSVRHDDRWKLV